MLPGYGILLILLGVLILIAGIGITIDCIRKRRRRYIIFQKKIKTKEETVFQYDPNRRDEEVFELGDLSDVGKEKKPETPLIIKDESGDAVEVVAVSESDEEEAVEKDYPMKEDEEEEEESEILVVENG